MQGKNRFNINPMRTATTVNAIVVSSLYSFCCFLYALLKLRVGFFFFLYFFFFFFFGNGDFLDYAAKKKNFFFFF